MSSAHPNSPAAFFSYVRVNDNHDNGKLSKLRERLEGEIHALTAIHVPIFQDRNDIGWGNNWKHVLDKALEKSLFFIPVLTPAFFESEFCRDELTRFLEREKALGRDDLIFPIHYIECDQLIEPERLAKDDLAKALSERNYVDWRELRLEPLEGVNSQREIHQMAKEFKKAMKSVLPDSAPAKSGKEKKPEATHKEVGSEVNGSKVTSINQPQILVVDAMARGDFTTLTEAVEKADPGTRILVRPGLYQGEIRISKPLEIIGEGPREEIIIESNKGNAVVFETTMGRIENLTIRRSASGSNFCINIVQGRLDLFSCIITSRSLSAIGIKGSADPRIRGNVIHDSEELGIRVYEEGRGTIEENDIYGSKLGCIVLLENAHSVIRGNRLHESKADGIYLSENAQARIEENEIYGNLLSGIEVSDSAKAMILRNRIYDQVQSGAYIHTASDVLMEGNVIFNNKYSGVSVHSESSPKVIGNEVFRNRFSGVAVKGGNPHVRDNRIYCNQEAIRVYDNGKGTFENNILGVHNNKRIYIEPSCLPNVVLKDNVEDDTLGAE